MVTFLELYLWIHKYVLFMLTNFFKLKNTFPFILLWFLTNLLILCSSWFPYDLLAFSLFLFCLKSLLYFVIMYLKPLDFCLKHLTYITLIIDDINTCIYIYTYTIPTYGAKTQFLARLWRWCTQLHLLSWSGSLELVLNHFAPSQALNMAVWQFWGRIRCVFDYSE